MQHEHLGRLMQHRLIQRSLHRLRPSFIDTPLPAQSINNNQRLVLVVHRFCELRTFGLCQVNRFPIHNEANKSSRLQIGEQHCQIVLRLPLDLEADQTASVGRIVQSA